MSADPHFPELNLKTKASFGLASPRDRLAAFILDVTLMLPLVQFFQAPVKKWILESLLFYKGTSAPLYELVNLFILGAVFVFYFSLSTFLFGQTVGKLFLKIKVISYHGKLSLCASVLRSLFTLFELACFGIPFLAMFSHSLRRMVHDRVSDTLVISLHNPVGFPQVSLKWKMGAIATVMAGFLFLTVLLYHSIDDEAESLSSTLVFDKKVCDSQFRQVDESLSAMIELYLVQKLNSECLFQKAREALWKNENKSLAQLAMSLAFEEDRVQSDRYLKSICDSSSEESICMFSQWLLNPKREESYNELYEMAYQTNQENFIIIFIASYARSLGDYKKTEEFLNLVADKKQLEPLLASLSFQSYLGQFKISEANALYKTHASLNEKNITEFIRFEMGHQNLTINQQVHILESFFPQILEQKQERKLASSSEISSEVSHLYEILKGAL